MRAPNIFLLANHLVIRLFLPMDDMGHVGMYYEGMIWVLSIFERIRLSRYCAAIRERNSCLHCICKKNIFCSKYTQRL